MQSLISNYRLLLRGLSGSWFREQEICTVPGGWKQSLKEETGDPWSPHSHAPPLPATLFLQRGSADRCSHNPVPAPGVSQASHFDNQVHQANTIRNEVCLDVYVDSWQSRGPKLLTIKDKHFNAIYISDFVDHIRFLLRLFLFFKNHLNT